jgi:hypothetical protein
MAFALRPEPARELEKRDQRCWGVVTLSYLSGNERGALCDGLHEIKRPLSALKTAAICSTETKIPVDSTVSRSRASHNKQQFFPSSHRAPNPRRPHRSTPSCIPRENYTLRSITQKLSNRSAKRRAGPSSDLPTISSTALASPLFPSRPGILILIDRRSKGLLKAKNRR